MSLPEVYIAPENSTTYVSFSSLGLVCSDFSFPPATPKTSYLDVLAADGTLDVSDAIRGSVAFNTVNTALPCIVIGSFDLAAFLTAYHGKRIKIYRTGDTKYHVGRCWVSDIDRSRARMTFALNIDADPFKYSLTEKASTINYITSQAYTPSLTYTMFGTWGIDVTINGGSVNIDKDSRSEYSGNSALLLHVPVTANSNYVLSYLSQYEWDNVFYGYVTEPPRKEDIPQMRIQNIGNFNSGSNTYITLYLRIKDIFSYAEGSSHSENITVIENVALFPHSVATTVVNLGDKIVVPTITASADGYLLVNGKTIFTQAGSSGLLWEMPLNGGNNAVLAYSNVTGSITLTFREGYL